MKSDQIKSLIGLILIFVAAVIIDLIYINAGVQAGQTFEFGQFKTLLNFRMLVLVTIYLAFFIAGYPLITRDYSSHHQTAIILVVGALPLIAITFILPRGPSYFVRNLQSQVIDIATSPVRVTTHYASALVGLGLYRLIRSFLPQKS